MEYAIGQVSEMLGLPISTLRYYDKEGLLPGLRRSSGIRRFSDRDIEALRMIAYLKRTGLGIDSIREFMAWDDESMECFGKRLQLLQRQQKALAEEMERLQGAMDMLTWRRCGPGIVPIRHARICRRTSGRPTAIRWARPAADFPDTYRSGCHPPCGGSSSWLDDEIGAAAGLHSLYLLLLKCSGHAS